MSTSTNLLILIIFFAGGIFLGQYLGVSCKHLDFGLLLWLVLYGINFYFAHKMGSAETKMRKFDLEKYWEVIEKNPSLVKDGSKVGFK